jgi:hypothetical protein
MLRNLIIAGVAVATAAGLFAAFTADAQIPGLPGAAMGSPAKSILGQASDAALDKLSRPGAFSADSAIRIGLPGQAKALGGVMKFAGQAGVGGDLDASLNEAAGQAASAAKPVFRAAIDHMSMQDMVGIGAGGGTGATDYLKKSAGSEIKAQIAPLVEAALGKTGVLAQSSKLSSLGISPATLIDYVSQKTADGIFLYMGREETSIRANPMKVFGH